MAGKEGRKGCLLIEYLNKIKVINIFVVRRAGEREDERERKTEGEKESMMGKREG